MLFNQMLLEEEKRLEKLSESLEEKLKQAPDGKLNVYKRGNKWRWYIRLGQNSQAVRLCAAKVDKQVLKKLAEKEADRRKLVDVKQQLEAISRYKSAYYKKHQDGKFLLQSRFEALRTYSPGMWELLFDSELVQWEKADYAQLQRYQDQKKTVSNRGLVTRSKSESIIATVLEDMEIPFHYEEQLMVGNTVLYPDFTLRHPQTAKTVYWEHFGLIEEPAYKADTLKKFGRYIEAGIFPGIQLICTFETRAEPMTFKKAKAYADYFLSNMM